MNKDARGYSLNNVLWIEHQADKDVYYRVKVLFERQPSAMEICKTCHRGELSILGHIVQYGMLDDEIYAVAHCSNCCAFTVFKYHVEHTDPILPESGDCHEEITSPDGF